MIREDREISEEVEDRLNEIHRRQGLDAFSDRELAELRSNLEAEIRGRQ